MAGPHVPGQGQVDGVRVVSTRTAVAVFAVFLGVSSAVVAGPLPPGRTGHFYVSNFKGDDVVEYDAGGTAVRRLTEGVLDGPRGIVIGRNRIFVAAQNSDTVVVFDSDRTFLDTFTAPELDGPTGMAFGPGGLLYVCSVENDSIVAFGPDGSVVRSFGGRGMKSPTCIATSGSWIYVSGPASPWIFRFDGNGTLRGTITGGGLVSPAGLAVYGGRLYVADRGSNRVVILDGKGNLKGEFTHHDLAGPQGLAFDDRGNLFVTNCYSNSIVQFNRSGHHVRTIHAGKLSFPDGVAFMSRRVGDIDDDGVVGVADFSSLIADWGSCPSRPAACSGDITRNGTVDVSDLYILLANWD
ncbi:MAG: hypothetical protein E2O40_03435 [Planctomycetota bacterium]|nr:MAG: hypothetical protein E2O40_03435 [Planctomycetota bacterium]